METARGAYRLRGGGRLSSQRARARTRSCQPSARHDNREAARQAVIERAGVGAHTVVLLAPGRLPRNSSGRMCHREALRPYLTGELAPSRVMTPLTLAGALASSTLA